MMDQTTKTLLQAAAAVLLTAAFTAGLPHESASAQISVSRALSDRGQSPTADENRAKARMFFAKGNRLLGDFQFSRAIENYRQALRHWNHPGIYFNLGLAQAALGQTLDAYHSVQQALGGGPEALGNDDDSRQLNHRRMLDLKKALRAQLAELRITSSMPGLILFVDHRQIRPDEGEVTMVVPGSHRLLAEKDGHRSKSVTLDLDPGDTRHIRFVSKRPFRTWLPWTVASVGAALTTAGAVAYWNARSANRTLQNDASQQCSSSGCTGDSAAALSSRWNGVKWRQRIGFGALAVGASALLSGAALILINRHHHFEMTATRAGRVSLVPIATPAMTGLAGTLHY
ncbi:MAG: tetratricopeptide repeat protein [Proteobacteria bacterium]|nr:tetratricopeptide repeat protein [Pseudomonadota bacterium]